MQSARERYLKDKQFHDRVYGEQDIRNAASKYYKIVGNRVGIYEDFLAARCPGRRVLEYGCGQGGHAHFLAEKGAFVSGIDLSDKSIEQAREAAKIKNLEGNIDFRAMNAEALEFKDDTFDIVCGTGILHHLDLSRAYSEIVRVLRPDGVAIFMEPLGHNPLINLYRNLTPTMRTDDEHPLRMEDLRLARSFFREVQVSFFHLLSLAAVPFWNTRFLPALVKTLDAADRFLFRRIPAINKYAWYSLIILDQPKKVSS